MDLNSILEKTKKTSDKIKRTRTPVSIATIDRPYEPPDLSTEVEQKSVSNNFKSDFKVTSKWLQSDLKVTSEVTSKYLQSDLKKEDNMTKSDSKVASEVTSQVASKWLQSDSKVASKCSFYTLIGVQKNLMILVFNECRKSLSKITDPLSIDLLSEQLNCPKKTVKTCTYRLEKRNLLHRIEYKDGRGGWTKYQLPTEIYHEIMQYETNFKVASKWLQSDSKVASELTSELTSTPSSSSNYINTTTELPDEWQKINISPLETIGFTMGHLTQLQKTGISSAEFVQDSIDYFGYDLANNNKIKEIKTNPIAYFMGIMKRVGVYTAPDNYESEKDRSLRIYLETKKQQKEKRAIMEAELIDIAYDEWVSEITEEEKKSLIPDHIQNSKIEGAKISALKSHFRRNVWPVQSKND